MDSEYILSDKEFVVLKSSIKVHNIGFLLSFSLALDEVQEFEVSLSEELVFEEHMFLFLGDFIDLTEPIHVQLSDKALNFLVSKVGGQDNVLHFFLILDVDLKTIPSPADNILELLFVKYGVELENEVWNLLGTKLFKISVTIHV